MRIACLLALLASCGYPKSAAAPATMSPAAVEAARSRWPGVIAASLERGRRVFLDHCNGCHDYPDRDAYDEPRWREIVPRMAHKADLSAAERDVVLQFVLASRTR